MYFFRDEDGSSKAEKVILVGNHSVGKTCLVRRYCENIYTDGYKATIGVDFMFKQYKILGREFSMHIWDTGKLKFITISSILVMNIMTYRDICDSYLRDLMICFTLAGQEQFRCVSKSYFRGAMAVLVAFDLGDPESLEDAKQWLEDVTQENSLDITKILVGNKSDVFVSISSSFRPL